MQLSLIVSSILLAAAGSVSAQAPSSTTSSAAAASTAPPACLLACVAHVAKQFGCNDLGDVHCVGSDHAAQVEGCLKDVCPNGLANKATEDFRDLYSKYVKFVKASGL